MMNGYRSYTNTPTDIRESPLGVGILRLNRLNPFKDPLTIGPIHRVVLDDKKDEFQKILLNKKLELESEITKLQIEVKRRTSVESEEGSGATQFILDEVRSYCSVMVSYDKNIHGDW